MYTQIPNELKELSRWVCWQGEVDENGKLRKTPINPKTGGGAMSNNPDTWTDFETAVRESKKYSGIGFMFAPPYFGVDIDHVDEAISDFRSGKTDNIVSEFIDTLCSYSEYSQSGKGIHIICRGELPKGGRRKNNVEMYQAGRYFIMTGNIASDYSKIAECTQTIKPLHEKYIGGGSDPTTGIQPTPINMNEQEILELAKKSRQGRIISDLYSGNWEGYFNSHSEADMSFCNSLAFWCRCDAGMMDRIFRSSGLMREKWNRRQSGTTYGALTIQKAIKSCNHIYEPPAKYSVSIGRSNNQPNKIYSLDDMGNAQRFEDAFSDSTRYSYVNKCWYYYDGRKWCQDKSGVIPRLADELIEEMKHSLKDYLKQPVDTEEIEKAFNKHLKYSRSNKGKKAMLAETMHHVPILPSQMDSHNNVLNTVGGIINLRNGTIAPHDAKMYLSKITNSEYTDKMDCPRWNSFLNDIFDGDSEMIHYIQKAVGYSLTGSTSEQCAFFCYGNGRNGKSTFLDVISNMMGDYAVNIQPETIMLRHGSGSGANSDLARLKGARLVTSVEPSEGMKLNEGLLKQLTGGDKVTARYQYGNEFEFTPEFKLWMGTNHKPIIRGTDIGIWRRVHLIPFTVTIPEEKVDKTLMYQLRQELPGILSWAVEGCLMWQREGLKKPSAVEAATKEYRSEMDVVSAFLDACCTVGSGREKASDLFGAYIRWAEENNEWKMSSRKFGQEMGKRFERTKSHGVRGYDGLKLNSEHKPYQVSFGGS